MSSANDPSQIHDKSFFEIQMIAALGVLFVRLKLCRVVDWNWQWATAPFWILLVVLALIGIFELMYVGLTKFCDRGE